MASTDLNINIKANDKASSVIKKTQSSMTKFSDSFKKNWVAISAGIIASIIAIKKAFEALKSGAVVQQQIDAFNNLGDTYAFNSEKMLKSMQEAAQGTITSFDLIQNASKALSLGIQADALPELLEISRKAARVMGEDAQFMFQSITMGIGRQSKLILDNLGIIVDAEKAYEAYADVLGKTASQLSDSEKKQAFLNEAVRQGKEKFADINLTISTSKEKIDKFVTSLTEFKDNILKAVSNSEIFNTVLNTLNSSFEKLNNLLKDTTPLEKNMQAINRLEKEYEELIRIQEQVERQGFSIYKDGSIERSIDRVTNAMMRLVDENEKLSGEEKQKDFIIAEKKKQLLIVANLEERKKKQKELEAAMYNSEKAMLDVGIGTARGLSAAFSDIFFNTMTGKISNLADIFSNFGNYVLRIMSQAISKLLLTQALMAASNSFGSTSAIGMGIAKVAGSFQTGSEGVPSDGLYKLHRGEQVTPAHETGGGGGGTTILNQFITPPQGTDTAGVASAVVNDLNSKGVVFQAMRRNM